MEEETDMSVEDFQRLIRDQVQRATVMLPGTQYEHSLIHLILTLLEKRRKQAGKLMQLCESVTACEITVKKLYSLLGWEYKDHCSDNIHALTSGSGHTQPLLPIHLKSHMNAPSPFKVPKLDASDHKMKEGVVLEKKAVVVLTKLTHSQTAGLFSQKSTRKVSEDGRRSSNESDMEWQSEVESNNLDISPNISANQSNKRRRIHHIKENRGKTGSTSQGRKSKQAPPASEKGSHESSLLDTSKVMEILNTNNTTKNIAKAATDPSDKTEATSKETTKNVPNPKTSRSISATQSDAVKAPTPSANTSKETTLTPVSKQPSKQAEISANEKIKVDMDVVARRKAFNWLPGKVTEIIRREDGKVKYKVAFQERGRSLVSGHHIAFDKIPKLEQLSVGARVVVKCQDDQVFFKPGIMAELPGRKNRMRFLVFFDDHTPMYARLQLIRLVFKPLADPFDDIPDESHRDYMRDYMERWPYPPLSYFKMDQTLNAEYKGTQQKCKVKNVDCSLIEVIFECDEHKEWLYRGSFRLEHMIRMRACMSNMTSNTVKK